MILRDIRDECALAVHDPDLGEISRAQWLMFLRSASMDARNSGWFLPIEDDESLEVAATTYEYDIPAGFAFIEKLYIEETINGSDVYINTIPRNHWEIRTNGGNPVITFSTLSELTPGKNIKIVGQARPSVYTDENQTVDRGMESFIRERALYFAFRYLGAGLSELARWRQQMSIQAWQTSEAMLNSHPQEFRMRPDARSVDGR